jgi:hypothetical protein
MQDISFVPSYDGMGVGGDSIPVNPPIRQANPASLLKIPILQHQHESP